MKSRYFIFAFILTVFLFGCSENDFDCRDNKAFCSSVQSQNLQKTETVINEFLKELSVDLDSQEKLERLRDWLQCKSCVAHAEIFCNSCIYTLPPISELKITFIIEDQETEKILDIIMSEPLRFAGYHD
ncbi:hypothetical protein EF405_11520 [Cyclobacteriaceae bacterium YHN15]|nr:hypothetical protein EF405_11520 [Cyclobacteriaceae bacterium YHN15]